MKIYTYPDKVLRITADPVENIDEGIQTLIDNMLQTMYEAPSGIGLAAPQVGETKRIIVYDLMHAKDKPKDSHVLINPEITAGEGEERHEEACLSVIDFSAEITRKAKVEVRGFDRHGKPVLIEADNMLAICLQHEIDHLNGTLILDYVSPLKRSIYKKKLQKKRKRH